MRKLIFDYAEVAKAISYSSKKRSNKDVLGLVIHYTGNRGDSAKNNMMYFSKKYGSNTRSAGAHIFIDANGLSARSIPFNRSAWSVGNPNNCYGHGAYFEILNNSNTVSIELCDIVDHEVTQAQHDTLIKVAKYIKKKCPNIKYIVRHYDIVKKDCPHYYVANPSKWLNLQIDLMVAMGLDDLE